MLSSVESIHFTPVVALRRKTPYNLQMHISNINSYPLTSEDVYIQLPTTACTYIIPDMHANPSLILQHLLRTKIMRWPQHSEQYWQRIVDFVNEPIPLATQQKEFRHYLKKFNTHYFELLSQAEFTTKHHLLLLGDLIGDRGPNDWFILLLLKVLKKHKVKFTINFSNHDYETYLWAVFNNFAENKLAGVIPNTQRRSLVNFHECYKRATKTMQQQMRNTYFNCYLKYVTLFAFTYDKPRNTVIITTHAPASIALVLEIAAVFDIKLPDIATLTKLLRLLKKLNKLICDAMINNPDYFVRQLCPLASGSVSESHYPPIVRAIWGRHYELQPERHRLETNYKIEWICGHMGTAIDSNLVTNLDISNLGKGNETSGRLCYSINW